MTNDLRHWLIPGFAGRWLLPGSGPGCGARVIDADFAWHYEASTDEEYQQAIRSLATANPAGFSRTYGGRILTGPLTPQPMWDLSEPDQVSTYEPRDVPGDADQPAVSVETLAFFSPAHFARAGGPRSHGIHLWPEGTASFAAMLQNEAKKARFTVTNRAAVVWAIAFLYLHEMFHQVVEDAVSVLEFKLGYAGSSVYADAQKRHYGYIMMEEALCNSFARTRMINFFGRTGDYEAEREQQARNDDHVYVPDPQPNIRRNALLRALDNVLRQSPPGYRDFMCFRRQSQLTTNLAALLQRLYFTDDPPHRLPSKHSFEQQESTVAALYSDVSMYGHWDYPCHWLSNSTAACACKLPASVAP